MKLHIKILLGISVTLSLVLFFLYIRAQYTLFLFPIYSDEIAFHVLLNRFGYDFPSKISLAPMCHATFPSYPWVWRLPASLSWFLWSAIASLKCFRLVGVVLSICF